ncbi:hybrid sensor histidine kinase/response regulator [Sphingomonas dokdonensis]|uniref:histidine kinase n=1 Tax=Sphingomonas dokdonensis TaxID=344880 RepID=A0A245ZNG8_9SPHN|nr:ATP-binding protein [Sphingomonas dokdonensis]OWK31298.1 blue-light-activated protein [Sphingomonas dokdonensis]
MTDLSVAEPRSLPHPLRFLEGGGEATRLILDRDWSNHPLGEPGGWSEALKATLSTVLNSPESMILAWGREELTFFFNETYFPLLGPRLEWAMGAPFRHVWADAWDQAEPIIRDAFAGRSRRFTDLPWKLNTDRGEADTWFTFSYSRILDGQGEIAGLFIFTNETTARVRADAALARSQAELRALNETLEQHVQERTAERDRVWQLTNDLMATARLDGYLLHVNPAWTRVLGWSEEELLTRPFIEIVDAADHAATADVVARLAAGELVTNFVDHVLTSDGGKRTIMWTAVPEEGSDLFYIIGRDLTEQHAVEDALRQAQKMQAVGQLTGGLAHDFNNLLTGMMGNLELLQVRLTKGRLDDLDRFVLAAQGAGRRAAALTQRLLAFSRRQTLDPRPADVNRLIAGMEDLLRRTIGPANALEVVGAGGLWTANIDAGQLENAVLNLCINARDAMPDGGRITIETANKWLDERAARERDLPPGQYLSICVTDTGTGMDQRTIERAFEPFFTTKPIGQGTGLGLSMIYGFARQSGGQVRIYSEVGEGTTMCIYLPRYAGTAETAEDVDAAVVLDRVGGGTVLIVDDEATIRHLVDEILDEVGYTVIGAADGAAGLKVLQSGARIDLLITDVGLPNGMNGRQVADAGRSLRPGLKILFITGYAENAAVGNGHLEPGMELLTKPFSLDALVGKVNEMMRSA